MIIYTYTWSLSVRCCSYTLYINNSLVTLTFDEEEEGHTHPPTHPPSFPSYALPHFHSLYVHSFPPQISTFFPFCSCLYSCLPSLPPSLSFFPTPFLSFYFLPTPYLLFLLSSFRSFHLLALPFLPFTLPSIPLFLSNENEGTAEGETRLYKPHEPIS